MHSATEHRAPRQRRAARAPAIAAIIVLAGVVLVAIVAGVRRPALETDTPSRVTRAGPSGLPLAPDILITMYQGEDVVGGRQVALSALWERRPVILNFWAGLCPPCRAEMPDFEALHRKRGAQFTLVGVDIGPFIGLGSHDDARVLLQELKVSYPAGFTADVRTVRNYQVLGMPTTVFITSQGRILRKYTGLLSRAQMDAFRDELLQASRAP
jgi:thiol-disulfide isomerase/thioredoxin